jgi:hypothetical protein
MPTVLRIGSYRFFFYSSDGGEPRHIHVERDDCEAKFWLDPVRLEWSHGFASHELNVVAEMVEDHEAELMEKWDEFFDS